MTNPVNSLPDCLYPLAYSVADAAKTAALGRTTIYKLIADGRLPVVKIGGRTLIRHDALIALLDAPAANDAAAPDPANSNWQQEVREVLQRRLESGQ